jgi:osmoprotectant transport system permease protein
MTPGEPIIRWNWIASHLGDIAQRLQEHLALTMMALFIGFVLAFLLSALVLHWPRAYGPVTWTTGVLYTIPSLALFALLVPYTGLSTLTAEIGLVSYTLLILVRSIVGGIASVPPEVKESALGMGYTKRQLFWQVELPLALGVIIAGVRVAAVTTVGLTTVTALIGQGGLGYFIWTEGILRFFSTPLIVGAVLSVVLAVLIDGALVLLQWRVTPWARARV